MDQTPIPTPPQRKVIVRRWLFGRLVPIIVRIVGALVRTKLIGWDRYQGKDQNLIFCGWHGKSLLFANQFRRRGYHVIISHSNDGDIQNENFRRLGFKTIRGSTGRGGVKAALSAVKVLKEGGTMAITPDGPRGPSRKVQGGVMLMAHKSGAGLVPIGIAAKPAIFFGSWDRYMLPIIFGKARLVFGDPIFVKPDDTPEIIESKRLKLESEIDRLEAEAEAALR